jgi:hypothetical protein
VKCESLSGIRGCLDCYLASLLIDFRYSGEVVWIVTSRHYLGHLHIYPFCLINGVLYKLEFGVCAFYTVYFKMIITCFVSFTCKHLHLVAR